MTNTITMLALTKWTDKQARKNAAPGEYEIDETVRVVGTIRIGEDYDTAPTVSLPMLPILALFIQRAGITRECSERLLSEVAAQAIGDDGKVGDAMVADIDGIKATLERVKRNVIAKLPRQQRTGPVKVNLSVDIVKE